MRSVTDRTGQARLTPNLKQVSTQKKAQNSPKATRSLRESQLNRPNCRSPRNESDYPTNRRPWPTPDPRRQTSRDETPQGVRGLRLGRTKVQQGRLVTYKARLNWSQQQGKVPGSTYPKGNVTPGRSQEGGTTTEPLKGHAPRTEGRAQDGANRTATKRRQRLPEPRT